jgi:hypothetical protein
MPAGITPCGPAACELDSTNLATANNLPAFEEFYGKKRDVIELFYRGFRFTQMGAEFPVHRIIPILLPEYFQGQRMEIPGTGNVEQELWFHVFQGWR